MAPGSEASQPFNIRVVAGLVAAGIAAFAAFLLLAAYATDFRNGRDGREHALSVAATGYKGLVDLIGYNGGAARLIRSEQQLDTEDLVVIAAEPGTDGKAISSILQKRGARATLLILPKWDVVPDRARPGWVLQSGLVPGFLYNVLLSKLGDAKISRAPVKPGQAIGHGWLDGIQVPVPARAQTISGKSMKPVLQAPDGSALIAQIGDRPTFIVADPDLMNNLGLRRADTARAALRILDALNSTDAETVSFDLTVNGFGEKPNGLRLLFEPPFVALTLALFAATVLAGLHGAFRFGPEEREERAIAFGKAALVENSASLLKLARREHRAGAAYAELVAEEAGWASGAGPSLRGAELEEYLDRLSAPGETKFSTVAARARAAATRDELVAAARALFSWKRNLIK